MPAKTDASILLAGLTALAAATAAALLSFPTPRSATLSIALSDPLPVASLSQTVEAMTAPRTIDRKTDCLARAVYFEDRSDHAEGQMAVARVVMNRTRSGVFADDVCEVLREPHQFSFVRHSIIPKADGASQAWRRSIAIAMLAIGGWPTRARDALFFHAATISPGWHRDRIGRIGQHVFYR